MTRPDDQITEQTITVHTDNIWETAIPGAVGDVKLDGKSLLGEGELNKKVDTVSEQVAHAHGSVDRTYQSVEKVDGKVTEVDRLFREEHRKTRALMRKINRGLFFVASVSTLIAITAFYLLLTYSFEQKSDLLKAQISDLKSDTEVLRAQVYKLHLVRLANHPFEGEIVAPPDEKNLPGN